MLTVLSFSFFGLSDLLLSRSLSKIIILHTLMFLPKQACVFPF